MAQIKRKNKWIGYTIYGVLLTVILLYYKFPEDAIEDYFQGVLYKINPELLFSFEGLSLSFPPGLKFMGSKVSLRKSPEKDIFVTETLSIRPNVWSLLKMDPEYRFMCSAYNGNISGSINIHKKNKGCSFHTSIKLKGIRVEDISRLADIMKRNVEGVLNGTLSYSGESASPIKGTGEVSLSLSNGSLGLTLPILSIKVIDFNEVSLRMSLKNQRINLSNADLKGKDILGEASGSISLDKDFLESRLDLKGAIEPLSDLFKDIPDAREAATLIKKRLKNGKLPFRISGTINEPRIQLI